VDASILQELPRNEVFVCKPMKGNQNRCKFYKVMDATSVGIAISQPCQKFFHLDEFELEYLSKKRCPLSYVKNVGDYGSL